MFFSDLPERGVGIAPSQPAITSKRATRSSEEDDQQTDHKRLVRGGGRRPAPLGQEEIERHKDSPQRSRTRQEPKQERQTGQDHPPGNQSGKELMMGNDYADQERLVPAKRLGGLGREPLL